MDKKYQDRFKITIIDDLRLIDDVLKTMSNKLAIAKEENSKSIHYYEGFIVWCQNLKSSLLETIGIEEATKEKIMEVELTQDQIETIILMRANNPFYKRVSAEYAKKRIEDLLDFLEDELEEDTYLDFDTRTQVINTKKIKEYESQIKEIVKAKAREKNIRVPVAERSRYASIEDYIEDHVRTLADSNGKLEVKRTPGEIFENIQDLAGKVQLLRNEGIIDAKENTYYHGILYHLAEYYVGISDGEQLVVEEGLRGIKVDKDIFRINQLIAEALYEVSKRSKDSNKNENPKIYLR